MSATITREAPDVKGVMEVDGLTKHFSAAGTRCIRTRTG